MLKKLFIWGNVVLVILLAVVMAQDYWREWKPYQKAYRKMQAAEEKTSAEKRKILARPIQIKQILATDLKRVDRCITCHQGTDPLATPTLANTFSEHPFKSHPGDFLENHPVEKFGCTVCHGGQGLATTFQGAAHQPKNVQQKAEWKKKYGWHREKHWEEPMLASPYIQASCVKCHGNVKELSGTDVVLAGKSLFRKHGCIGCHQWEGEGGVISVDLSQETSNKPLSRIDFSTAGLDEDERTLLNWIRLHFVKDPWELVPGDPTGEYNTEPIAPSGMPDYSEELSEDDATALTTHVLSARRDHIPHTYFVPGDREPPFEKMWFPSRIAAGKWVYKKHGCAGCHGEGGVQGRRNYNYPGGVEPTLTKMVGTYSRKELRLRLENGVLAVDKDDPKGPTPPLYMPAWKDKIKGEEMEALLDYLLSIAEKDEDEW